MRNIKQIIDFTGGYNLFVDPTKLLDNEFQEFENVNIFSKGKYYNACLRNGYRVYNQNPTKENSLIIGLYEYITNSKDNNYKLLILKTDNSLEKITGEPYKGQPEMILKNDPATKKVNFITFKDILYIINRNDGTNYYSNLRYNGVDYFDHGIEPCLQTFKLDDVLDSNSKMEQGVYAYLITFIYENNQESFVIPTRASNYIGSNELDEQTSMYSVDFTFHFRYKTNRGGRNITISEIPTGGSNVIARRIYRTKGKPGKFYFLTQINDNTTTTYIDRKSNDNLVEEYTGDLLFKPYIAKYATQHKGRLWLANLKENQFSLTPDTTKISYSIEPNPSGTTTPTVRKNGRIVKYKYKFAYLYLDFIKDTSASYEHELNTYGFLGKKSQEFDVENNRTENGEKYYVIFSPIPQDNPYSKQIAIFRNNCILIDEIVITNNIGTISFENTGGTLNDEIINIFKKDQVVRIENCGGTIPNDDYTITDVLTTEKKIKVNLIQPGYTHTRHTGILTTYEYYYIGTTGTNITEYKDAHEDAEIYKNNSIYKSGNIEEIDKDRTYKSLVVYSEIDKGDIFPPYNQFPIEPDDNDEITGIFSEEEGLTIFKERGIYKLYTYTHNNNYWQLRKVCYGIGATDPDAIVQLPTGQYIFMFNKVFYIWQMGTYPERISDKIQTILDNITFEKIEAIYDPITNRVIIVYSTPTQKGNVLIFDLRTKSWHHYTGNIKSLGLCSPYVLKSGKILFGSIYKRIYYESDEYLDEYLLEEGENQAIKLKIRTKEFDTYNLDIKRIGIKLYSKKENVKIKITPFVDGVAQNELTSFTTAGENRITQDINIQNAKRFSIQIETGWETITNSEIAIRELMFEYEERHQYGGWK